MVKKRELKHYEGLLQRKIEGLIGKAGETLGGMSDQEESYADPTDQAAMEADRNFLLRIRDRERKLILKAREALARIEGGTYGFCENCGEEISASRLEARPEATLCIECKNEMEDREKRARFVR